MPLLNEIVDNDARRILLVGHPGGGKTALLTSLPGKGFVYMFDTAGLKTLQLSQSDLMVERFMPDRNRTDVVPLSKEGAKKVSPEARQRASRLKPEAAQAWDRHFSDMIDNDGFKPYDFICFDSLTTFGEIIMDAQLYMNGRYGTWPQQDDYGPVMTTITNTIRTLMQVAPHAILIFTAHLELQKDKISERVTEHILTYGKLKYRMPTMFSDIFLCEAASAGNTRKWILKTVSDHRHQYIRTSIPGLDNSEDVTISDWSKANNGKQGLGRIIV